MENLLWNSSLPDARTQLVSRLLPVRRDETGTQLVSRLLPVRCFSRRSWQGRETYQRAATALNISYVPISVPYVPVSVSPRGAIPWGHPARNCLRQTIFGMLVDEIKKPEPRPGRITRLFASIKQFAPEVASILSSAAKIGELIRG